MHCMYVYIYILSKVEAYALFKPQTLDGESHNEFDGEIDRPFVEIRLISLIC